MKLRNALRLTRLANFDLHVHSLTRGVGKTMVAVLLRHFSQTTEDLGSNNSAHYRIAIFQ